MALKFSANLSTLFTDIEFENRFEKAKEFGFKSIEIQNPYVMSPMDLKSKLQGLNCDLINIHGGSSGFGCASMPVHQEEFLNSINRVGPYHDALGFKKLHILSGEKMDNYTRDDQVFTLVETLTTLVSGDYLENINVIGLIEPICSEVNDKYFLNNFETAIGVINKVGSNQIKLLLDIYHLHKITGDVKKFLEMYYPYAGHIQISQDPGRKEPFCKDGKIDYTFVFDFLRQQRHADYIGLEYFLLNSTEKSFDWMKNYTG